VPGNPLKQAEEHLATGAYVQARREAERLIASGGLRGEYLGRAYALAAQAAFALRDCFGSVRLAEKALAAAGEAANPEILAGLQLILGSAYAALGDPHQARQHLGAFLERVPSTSVPAGWVASAHRHLGLALRQQRAWRQASAEFDLAAELLGAAGQEREQASAQLDSAWCLFMAGQPEEAALRIEQAGEYGLRSQDPELTADLLCHKALLCRHRGDLAGAAALCQEVFIPGKPGVGAEQQALAAWIAGECALDLVRREEAEFFANLALSHALAAGRPSLMNLAGDLRRRLLAK